MAVSEQDFDGWPKLLRVAPGCPNNMLWAICHEDELEKMR